MHVEDRCIRILKSEVGSRKSEIGSGKWEVGSPSSAFVVSVLFLLEFFLYFLQGDVDKGRELIEKGIKMREELGVPLYTAAGNCDLGSE